MKLVDKYRAKRIEWGWRCPDGQKHSWSIMPSNPVWPGGITGTPFGDLGQCDNCGQQTYLNEPTR